MKHNLLHALLWTLTVTQSFNHVKRILGGLASNGIQPPDDLFEHLANIGPQSHGIIIPEA
jgi:hypothetical protein